MENWKDIVEEKTWAYKAKLVTLFLMGWEAPKPTIMLEFFNTFMIKSTNIYFGHKVYVISKQFICRCFWSMCRRVYRRPERAS